MLEMLKEIITEPSRHSYDLDRGKLIWFKKERKTTSCQRKKMFLMDYVYQRIKELNWLICFFWKIFFLYSLSKLVDISIFKTYLLIQILIFFLWWLQTAIYSTAKKHNFLLTEKVSSLDLDGLTSLLSDDKMVSEKILFNIYPFIRYKCKNNPKNKTGKPQIVSRLYRLWD